jgi:pyridoxal 5'-phosphate synthase pdxT subunit
MSKSQKIIGVLALQGDFSQHLHVFRELGVSAKEVRSPGDLADCSGLVIPGGESTTISKLLDFTGLRKAIHGFKRKPIWGLCAGSILLAKRVEESSVISLSSSVLPLGLMDIVVERNAYGRQSDSFVGKVQSRIKKFSGMEAVFIRAPIIQQVGKKGNILGKVKNRPVLVQQGRLLVSTFHPELTKDRTLYDHFLGML